MITIKITDLEYKGIGGFEDIRDEIYGNKHLNTGCISAGYSAALKIGIFVFVSMEYIPERLQNYAKTYHPVPDHYHTTVTGSAVSD